MHGRRRSRRFTIELTLCATLHVCRARDLGSRRETTNACALAGYTSLMSDASTGGCLLTCGWTACGRDNDSLFLLLSRLLQGHPQNPKRLEIWFLQIPDYQFKSTIAPMQEWLRIRSPSKFDTEMILVLDGN